MRHGHTSLGKVKWGVLGETGDDVGRVLEKIREDGGGLSKYGGGSHNDIEAAVDAMLYGLPSTSTSVAAVGVKKDNEDVESTGDKWDMDYEPWEDGQVMYHE